METRYASNGSSVLAKKLWGLLRVAFFTTRKKLISSKRKLMMELINLTIIIKSKRLLRESLNNLISLHGHGHCHHHHHHHHTKWAAAGIMKKRRSSDHPLDYEFSCSNSPIINPVVYSIVSGRHFNSRGHRGYFNHSPLGIKEGDLNVSCVDQDIDNALMLLPPQTPDQYNFNLHLDGNDPYVESSPVSVVKVSDYSSDEDDDDDDDKDIDDEDRRNAPWVDDEAEDFIRRFKEQLRAQTTTRYYLQHTTTSS